jgi:hypothetical protein
MPPSDLDERYDSYNRIFVNSNSSITTNSIANTKLSDDASIFDIAKFLSDESKANGDQLISEPLLMSYRISATSGLEYDI